MGYATITQVESYNPQRGRYTAGTVPTLAQVEAFIEQIADHIDSVLAAQGVSVPVTAPANFLSWLGRLNALGAAAQAELAAFPEVQTNLGGSFSGARYQRMYDDGIKQLIAGSAIPPTAGTAGARITATAYGVDNPDPVTGEAPAPLFSVTQVF